jgi:BTB/POZ domain
VVEEDVDESDSKVGQYVSIYLQKNSEDLTVDANFTVRVGSITRSEGPLTFSAKKSMWGWDFVKRQRLLDKTNKFLDDCGTLVIEVDLQVYVEKSPVWYPPMPIRNDDSKVLADLLLEDDDPASCSDVTFKVGNQEFKLHRFLLATRAPVLFQMITSVDQTITLPDVDADSFRSLVRLIYTGDWLSSSFINNANEAKSLLTTANRFGCSRLKLLVESFMVEKVLDASNAADLLLLGESHTCALLKEAAMKICQNSADAVMDTDGWKRLRESSSLLEELFSASHRKQSMNQADDTVGQSVAELRDRLLKRGRDVDGSREMLVKRLKAE